MTVTQASPTTYDGFELFAVDLYRDIHKGIRAELFAVTNEAGRVDPADQGGRQDVADHVRGVIELLESHAEHEDAAVLPRLEQHLPALAEKISDDHATIDGQLPELQALADAAAGASPGDERRLAHLLYLDLSSFTSEYLIHQDVEERVVMPQLEAAVGFDEVLAIHQSIVGSIPPDEMAKSLAVMLPAMNIDDRAGLLGGMQAGAPPEVFEGIWGLAGSVLSGPDHVALGTRLGLA